MQLVSDSTRHILQLPYSPWAEVMGRDSVAKGEQAAGWAAGGLAEGRSFHWTEASSNVTLPQGPGIRQAWFTSWLCFLLVLWPGADHCISQVPHL